MSAPRSSMRVLRHVARTTSTVPSRSLHMTGPATYPSPAMNRDMDSSRRPTIDTAVLPSTAGLEDSMLSSEMGSGARVRHFNTSRSLKAVGDSSTIDFAYLPDFDPDTHSVDQLLQVRVPILPDAFAPSSTKTSYTPEEEEIVMRPQISLAAASSTYVSSPSALAEVHDNSAVDFQGVVSQGAAKASAAAAQEIGTLKRVWGDFLDDVLGSAQKGSKS